MDSVQNRHRKMKKKEKDSKVQQGWEKFVSCHFYYCEQDWECVSIHTVWLQTMLFPFKTFVHIHTHTSTNTIDVDFSFVLFYGIQQIIFAYSRFHSSIHSEKAWENICMQIFSFISRGTIVVCVYFLHGKQFVRKWTKKKTCNIKSSFFFTFSNSFGTVWSSNREWKAFDTKFESVEIGRFVEDILNVASCKISLCLHYFLL